MATTEGCWWRERFLTIASVAMATLIVVLIPAGAQKSPALEPVKRMEKRYRAAKTLQATFLERYTEGGRTVRVESGMAYFRRPGKMRWEYAAPESNLFLIDGKMAWFYVPADHTVTRVPAKQSTDWRTPLALLAGETKVSRVCSRVAPALDVRAENPDNEVFGCTLRAELDSSGAGDRKAGAGGGGMTKDEADSQISEGGKGVDEDTVLLEIGRESGELARIVVRDKGGIGIEFKFKNWVEDPAVAEALFHFQVPQGVAIVNGELPTGNPGSQP